MKKFVALLIFAGLTSAVFAKSTNASEIKNQTYGNEYQQSENTSISYAPINKLNVYASVESGYIQGGEYDGYGHYDHWYRHHHHHYRRHWREHRRFHREHYY